MSKRKSIFIGLLLSGIFAAVLCALVFVEPPFFMVMVPRKDWADYQRWRTLVLPDNPELRHPKPYPPELLDAARRTIDVFRTHPGFAIELAAIVRGDDDSSTVTLVPVSAVAPELRAYADQLRLDYVPLQAFPEFEQDVFFSSLMIMSDVSCLGMKPAEFSDFEYALSGACLLEAIKRIESGDQFAAAGVFHDMNGLFRYDPYSSQLMFAIQAAVMRTQLAGIATLVEANPDPAFVRLLLEDTQKIRFDVEYPEKLNHPGHLDAVGSVRYFQKRGLAVSIPATADMVNTLFLPMRLPAAYLEQEIDRFRGPNPGCAESLTVALHEAQLLARQATSDGLSFRNGILANYRRGTVMPMLYQMSPAVMFDRFIRMRKLTRAQLDLLNIRLASILLEHESGRTPSAWKDLSPVYFPKPPTDPFASDGASYLLQPVARSRGPDGDDDEAKVLHDHQSNKLDGDVVLQYSVTRSSRWREAIPDTR